MCSAIVRAVASVFHSFFIKHQAHNQFIQQTFQTDIFNQCLVYVEVHALAFSFGICSSVSVCIEIFIVSVSEFQRNFELLEYFPFRSIDLLALGKLSNLHLVLTFTLQQSLISQRQSLLVSLIGRTSQIHRHTWYDVISHCRYNLLIYPNLSPSAPNQCSISLVTQWNTFVLLTFWLRVWDRL